MVFCDDENEETSWCKFLTRGERLLFVSPCRGQKKIHHQIRTKRSEPKHSNAADVNHGERSDGNQILNQ